MRNLWSSGNPKLGLDYLQEDLERQLENAGNALHALQQEEAPPGLRASSSARSDQENQTEVSPPGLNTGSSVRSDQENQTEVSPSGLNASSSAAGDHENQTPNGSVVSLLQCNQINCSSLFGISAPADIWCGDNEKQEQQLQVFPLRQSFARQCFFLIFKQLILACRPAKSM